MLIQLNLRLVHSLRVSSDFIEWLLDINKLRFSPVFLNKCVAYSCALSCPWCNDQCQGEICACLEFLLLLETYFIKKQTEKLPHKGGWKSEKPQNNSV